MGTVLPAAVFVIVAWWASTSAVYLGNGLPRRVGLAVASAFALAGLVGLVWSSGVESSLGAYLAFSSALAVWAWHELAFLLGVVTGPRKEPCPAGARGWRRFAFATSTIIHHELALALTLAAVIALTWGAPNQVGSGLFLVLWTMRLSAKLNLFLGVKTLATELVPVHLRYLLTYFGTARMNPLMPVSVVGAGAVVVLLGAGAAAADASEFMQVGRTLLATVLGLAVVEHLFLALPVDDGVLWRWAVSGRERRRAPRRTDPEPRSRGGPRSGTS